MIRTFDQTMVVFHLQSFALPGYATKSCFTDESVDRTHACIAQLISSQSP